MVVLNAFFITQYLSANRLSVNRLAHSRLSL